MIMTKQLKDIAKNTRCLSLFNVFTSDAIEGHNCKGNPAIVLLLDSLPSLEEHLTIFNYIKNNDIKKRAIPEAITLVYISPNNQDNNLVENLSDAVDNKLNGSEYSIRWFSATSVIKRCGHGTLAAAAFIRNTIYDKKPSININSYLTFHSDNESLKVTVFQNKKTSKNGVLSYSLQLKNELLIASNYKMKMTSNLKILRESKTQDDDGYLIIELSDETAIKEFTLTKDIIDAINKRALIITAQTQNKHYDLVFRYFAPFYGELEDNATGSAASLLTPFWEASCFKNKRFNNERSEKTSQTRQLRCYQASKNGGFFIINSDDNSHHLSTTSSTIEVIGHVTEKVINYDSN
jgi:predicted PhzF superfamily epimerase YddE/YHI9